MRVVPRQDGVSKRTSKKNPLAEGVIPLDCRGRRNWEKMSDDQILEIARKTIDEKGVKSRKGLEIDGGLYFILRKRNLLDKIEFDEVQRNWKSKSDDELVSYAQNVIDENGMKSRWSLGKGDSKLYNVLTARKLLDRLEFEEKRRYWSHISDDQLVAHAQKLIEKDKVKSRGGLEKKDNGLYQILRTRKLLDELEFEVKKKETRNWRDMTDDAIVAYARKIVDKKGMKSKKDLEKEDQGLYHVLLRRKLLDQVEFEVKKKEERNWKDMTNNAIVAYAQKVIDDYKVKSRGGLNTEDSGLYNALRKKRLLSKLEFEVKRQETRNWKSMSDDELAEYGEKIIEEKAIKRRSALSKEDQALYQILRERKLLGRVFANLEQSKQSEAVQQVVDGLREFGEVA